MTGTQKKERAIRDRRKGGVAHGKGGKPGVKRFNWESEEGQAKRPSLEVSI